MKTVAIIGGGPSGITSAKYSLSNGLEPTVFEINSSSGGLWAPNTKIWSTLKCNFTRYSMVFSDFPWPQDSAFTYAHRDQIYNYLQNYVEHFNLKNRFKLNSRVDLAEELEDKRWKLNWTNLLSNEKFEKVFDFLIVASGFNTLPNMAQLENQAAYKGLVMHSCDYKVNDENLKDKRVLVVGSSNSSVEIASDLVGYAMSVVNLFRRPFWVVDKFIKMPSYADDNAKEIFVPRDFLFYTRKFTYSKENKYKNYSTICPDQANKETCPADLYIDPLSKDPVNFGVSENYYRHVKAKQIETKRGQMKKFTQEGIELQDGSIIQADVVLFCTGYKLQLPFFNQKILNELKFDENNYKNPTVLYKLTFHPSFSNLAFIFLTRGLFFAGLELQSKWVSLVFSGKQSLPSVDEMQKEIELNETKRKSTHSSVQFPHGMYVEVIDQIGKQLGALPLPDFENNPLMHEKFWNYLVVPAHFIYNENKEFCLNVMEKIEHITKHGVSRDEN